MNLRHHPSILLPFCHHATVKHAQHNTSEHNTRIHNRNWCLYITTTNNQSSSTNNLNRMPTVSILNYFHNIPLRNATINRNHEKNSAAAFSYTSGRVAGSQSQIANEHHPQKKNGGHLSSQLTAQQA